MFVVMIGAQGSGKVAIGRIGGRREGKGGLEAGCEELLLLPEVFPSTILVVGIIRGRRLIALLGSIHLFLCDFLDVIGGKPASAIAEKAIPPTRLQLCEDFDEISLLKSERRVILGDVIIERSNKGGGLLLLTVGGVHVEEVLVSWLAVTA